MRNMFGLIKNAIIKSLIIFKIFLKKVIELFLCHQMLSFKAIFILLLLPNHCFIKKQSCKKNLIRPIGFGSFKIIFILLIKPIAI